MASTSKCLAPSNKSHTRGKAKRSGRASAYRDAIPASVFGRLYARDKIGIGVAHENVPEIGDARDGAHRSGRRLRGGLDGRSDWQPPRSPARTAAHPGPG